MDKIKKYFSETIDNYDTVADRVVFKNEELHKNLIDAIPFKKNRAIKVLDLGCGTGHGMQVLCDLFLKAEVTGIDFSNKMIMQTKKYLSKYSKRIKLIENDFNKVDFEQEYDAIISAIAIHNSSHNLKKRLFKKIYNSLSRKGVFINGDFYADDSVSINKQLKKLYRDYLYRNLSGRELKVWLNHAFEEDKPMSLTKQFTILRRINFQQPKLLWRFNNEAIYIAYKNLTIHHKN